MAFKPNVNFGASNVIDPTAGARQALQSVGGLLDDYGKRQQSTQEMLLREQGRQDALVQQDIANKRADAQLQLSQNQDARAADAVAKQAAEENALTKYQQQLGNYGSDVVTDKDAQAIASAYAANPNADVMGMYNKAIQTYNTAPQAQIDMLRTVAVPEGLTGKDMAFARGDVINPLEKKIETDEQQAFQAEQNKLTRDQSASQFNKTFGLQQKVADIAAKERAEKREATLAMAGQDNIYINPDAADYKINAVPKNIEEAYSRLESGKATDSDKSNIAKYEKTTTEFIDKATATRASTTLENLDKARKADPYNVEIANQYNLQKAANEQAIAKLKADLTKQNNELALSADKSTGGNSSGTDKAASIDTIYKGMGIDAKTATKEDKQIASQILATGATEKQVGDITGAEGFRSEGGWLSNASYSADLSDKLAAIKTANTRTPGAGAELQKAIANTESQIEALQPPKSDKELVSKYESSVNALGVEKKVTDKVVPSTNNGVVKAAEITNADMKDLKGLSAEKFAKVLDIYNDGIMPLDDVIAVRSEKARRDSADASKTRTEETKALKAELPTADYRRRLIINKKLLDIQLKNMADRKAMFD